MKSSLIANFYKAITIPAWLAISSCSSFGFKYQVETIDIITKEKTLIMAGCETACSDAMGGAWCNYFSQRAIEQCIDHASETEYRKEIELIKRFHDLARKGDADSQKKLGYMYYKGLGVKTDYAEAIKWYTLSAKTNSSAQYSLGVMYFNGHGVDQDYSEAMKWFRVSANNGHQEAIKTINFLKENYNISG